MDIARSNIGALRSRSMKLPVHIDMQPWDAQASVLWYKNSDGSWREPLIDPELRGLEESLPSIPSSGEGSLLP